MFTPGHVGVDASFLSLRSDGMRTSPILTMLLRERLRGLVDYLLFLAIAALIALQIEAEVPEDGRGFLLLTAVLSGVGCAVVPGARYIVYLLRLASFGQVNHHVGNFLELVTVCFLLLNVASLIVGLAGYGLAFTNHRTAESATASE
jgi:hypothetical protein